ncbi:Scr1 family TA system antitoxin-like transcriptional regulator [Streptomyces sp. NBC_01515]|uniref:Scr1 family TA system antitoxin-like transcriptional regulator n=1 Tax=Streptomyces sp. NBC_01515 TaxID=2903890 RepID=UPI00386583DC
MLQMQLAEALATCEQALRSLISTVLAKKLGKDWVSQVFPEERAVKIRGVRGEESGRRTRRGVASVPSSELAYAQFCDLYLEKHSDVRHYSVLHDHLQAQALDPDSSRDFITDVTKTYIDAASRPCVQESVRPAQDSNAGALALG